MGIWIDSADVEAFLSPAVTREIFDDTNLGPGVFDPSTSTAVTLVIDMAEGQTASYLAPEYVIGNIEATDRLVRSVALEFARAYAFERHEELVRSGRAKDMRERADALALRIQSATQRLPDTTEKPANAGGVVVSNGPRAFIDNPSGTYIGGDF
jgi:hypothetical protein